MNSSSYSSAALEVSSRDKKTPQFEFGGGTTNTADKQRNALLNSSPLQTYKFAQVTRKTDNFNFSGTQKANTNQLQTSNKKN